MNPDLAGDEPAAQPVARARTFAFASAAALLILAVISDWVPLVGGAGFLVGPASILGIVSPAIGYRLFQYLREQVPAEAGVPEREARFVRASVSALSVTAATGLFGVVVFALVGEMSALIAVLSHAILTGALWPSAERLEGFLDREGPGPPGAG